MPVKYRAVHTRKPWRQVGIHKTLHSAIEGRDGAKNLLLRVGRVGKKWEQYGDVLAVFVWEDGSAQGYALRISPSTSDVLERATVPASELERLDSNNGCTAQEIESYFRAPPAPVAPGSSQVLRVDDPISTELRVGRGTVEFPYPDELPRDEQSYVEGLVRQVTVNAYERDRDARSACIAHYGLKCQVCDVDFALTYGELGRGFIHVHHLIPIASIGVEYRVDPVADLTPVCPNCHAMLHRQDPPLTIQELKALLRDG